MARQSVNIMQLDEQMRCLAQDLGTDFYGIADLSPAYDFVLNQGGPDAAGYPRAISIGIVLQHAIVDQLPRREERAVAVEYRHHAYDVVNDRLDLIASRLGSFLQRQGYRALPVPASKRVDDGRICAIFSHKLAAHLAGLGWIGKSCLLITPKAGPRVRWATVLTDSPLQPTGQPLGERCGDCQKCVEICPVGAFSGRPFREDEPREARYDARKCEKYFKDLEKKTGLGVCGLCLYVCPFGKRERLPREQYSPTMTKDYSRISDTARAVDAEVLPRMASYIRRISPQIAAMSADEVFVIADYGAADGVNSSELFEAVIRQIHEVNPTLTIKLVYIDLADPANFETFWATSALAKLKHVEAQYIQRSFYEPFPEMTGKLQIGFSSTALHWLNTKTVGPDYFQHPLCIQPNQLPDSERKKFAEKWKADWRSFLHECSTSLVKGGALFFANLANLGDDRWPASAGYNSLRDICQELCEEKKLSDAELNAIFIPDYFASPHEMSSLLDEDDLKCFAINACDPLTVPCAYFTKAQDKLDDPQERSKLAATLAHVVRAWSESSMRIGLHADNKDLIEDIYRRLQDKFYEKPEGLPYQYCLLELVKKT